MITAVTTHQFSIFKLFYENKLHDILKENLVLYVDKEDDKEIQQFRDIVDLSKTRIFTRKDIMAYYGSVDLYLPNAPYCKKMYFLNMIFHIGFVNDDLYMTDDDVLVYDESFYEMMKHDKIVHDRDTWPKIEDYKRKWPIVYKWYKDNIDGKPIHMMATNFFVPKVHIKEVKLMFINKFASFIRLLKSESDFIDKLNKKSKCNRNCDFSVFYLEVPFFDDVFASLNHDYLQKIPITCVSPSELGKLRDKLNTKDAKLIMSKFVKKALYPKKQPLLHFNFADKEAMMIDVFNYLNDKPMKYPNINDLLKVYPKQAKKISLTKSLF
jgi:hypothetical protein